VISFERYARLFRVPGLRAALWSSVVGRLPMGIGGLAILLYLQSATGSFAAAGVVSALYVLGLAAIAPLVGRMIDRLGPRPVLALTAIGYPAALVLLVVLVEHGAGEGWIALIALAAGSMLPPITICMRTLFPRLLDDVDLLQTAYSVDSILIETIFVAGPALIALFVAVNLRGGAVLFAAACAIAGSALFMQSPAIRQWARPAARLRTSLLGPLRNRPLLALYLATMLYSIAFGLLEVAVTAQATLQGRPAAAGVILALASVGSGLGALVYGSRSWIMPAQRQYVIAQFAMATGLFVLAPVTDLYWLGALCVVACSPMAPVIALQSVLVARLTPQTMLAESFTWAATALLGGVSAGIAAGGAIVDAGTPTAAMMAAGAATLLAAVVSAAVVSRGAR
jgi:predicted MFS family arabinose efflux permease